MCSVDNKWNWGNIRGTVYAILISTKLCLKYWRNTEGVKAEGHNLAILAQQGTWSAKASWNEPTGDDWYLAGKKS